MGTYGNGNSKRGKGAAGTKDKAGSYIAYDDMRFCNIELQDAEKKEFRSLLADGGLELLVVNEYVTAGYELTFKRDKKGGGVLVSLRAAIYGLDNEGLVITGRGGDTDTAFAVLSYKINHLVGDRLWAQAEAERGNGVTDIG